MRVVRPLGRCDLSAERFDRNLRRGGGPPTITPTPLPAVRAPAAIRFSSAVRFCSTVFWALGSCHIDLDQFAFVTDMLLAICYKQSSEAQLQRYEQEVRTVTSNLPRRNYSDTNRRSEHRVA
jgi:hypothetical protein